MQPDLKPLAVTLFHYNLVESSARITTHLKVNVDCH